MSRVAIQAAVKVYAKDEGYWGEAADKITVETYWNDESGEYVVMNIDGHAYTMLARDLRAAIQAVTTR